MTSTGNLADILVDRLSLSPPVDILHVIENFADLEQDTWTFDCDGLTTRLTGPGRPKIFLKANQAPNRKRFTAAHELGHVLIPWHIEELPCTLERFSKVGREQEATTFASHLMVPRLFLREILTASLHPSFWLQQLEVCEVSAEASVRALESMLVAGYTFAVDQGPGNREIVVHTSGTSAPTHYGRSAHEAFEREAVEHGKVSLRGRTVRWYRYIIDELPRGLDISGLSNETLDELVLNVGEKLPDGRPLRTTLASMVGGKLREPRHSTIGQKYGSLVRHMGLQASTHPLLRQQLFHKYLAQRAAELHYKGR